MTSKKPNILLIMVDQLTAPALRCYGNSITKTPNIDQLVESGTLFENNYCNFPIWTCRGIVPVKVVQLPSIRNCPGCF